MKPLPDGVDCEELTVDTKSDGPWISLQGRPRGTQRIAQYRLPRAVVIHPEVADLQGQRLEAIFLGTTPPEPNRSLHCGAGTAAGASERAGNGQRRCRHQRGDRVPQAHVSHGVTVLAGTHPCRV